MIIKYLGKRSQKCAMCHETSFNSRFFLWRAYITRQTLEVCFKCAKREVGSSKKSKEKLRKLYE